MKTKFAKEKSEYAHYLQRLLEPSLTLEERNIALSYLNDLEDHIKKQGDKMIFIVTTRDTNPMKECTAPPMSEKDIKA
ncbi:hypothetical protein LCGC14_0372330 [marine sediment metagenome]|uniref:Uncharacterized protein n=1 Tax=marine sediment metagenome TaxID=412755 RepID=A0A0F9TMP3_9ZZZZ